MMALRRKLISASVYPLILVTASVAVLFLLLIYVVPAFTKTYFESGTQLPAITMVLINVSNGIKNNFIYLVLLAILITAGWGTPPARKPCESTWISGSSKYPI